jgi:hypothetical protein
MKSLRCIILFRYSCFIIYWICQERYQLILRRTLARGAVQSSPQQPGCGEGEDSFLIIACFITACRPLTSLRRSPARFSAASHPSPFNQPPAFIIISSGDRSPASDVGSVVAPCLCLEHGRPRSGELVGGECAEAFFLPLLLPGITNHGPGLGWPTLGRFLGIHHHQCVVLSRAVRWLQFADTVFSLPLHHDHHLHRVVLVVCACCGKAEAKHYETQPRPEPCP